MIKINTTIILKMLIKNKKQKKKKHLNITLMYNITMYP